MSMLSDYAFFLVIIVIIVIAIIFPMLFVIFGQWPQRGPITFTTTHMKSNCLYVHPLPSQASRGFIQAS